MQKVGNFVTGKWVSAGKGARPIANAVTGAVFAEAGNQVLDFDAIVQFAKDRGGPALRRLSFHDRARMLKALALFLDAHKEALYEVSYATGATLDDHKIDVDGGIGTLFVFASKGRREMPDGQVLPDGSVENLSRSGTFLGQHVYLSKPGAVVQVNAFNFPVWGMLEKLAPAILAGVPSIVKPATVTSYVAEACVRLIDKSGILPPGVLQLVTGEVTPLFERLDCQDMVAFTGSAHTSSLIRSSPAMLQNRVGFTAEQDSLNASILGPDALVGTPEFDLLVEEVGREMTVKCGQKCTAVRRILVPERQVDGLVSALSDRLSNTVIGDPRRPEVQMGALVSRQQKSDVLEKVGLLASESERVWGHGADWMPDGVSQEGAFMSPMLFLCGDPDKATHVHMSEAFGPVATILPYRDLDHAIHLANRGGGSLVASVITHDPKVARQAVIGMAPWHGRLYFNDRTSMAESTGHGSPMPHMTHGGPGRAGGGEELGGIRAVKHYMQRTALQGSPDHLAEITGAWVPGAAARQTSVHPFRRRFGELAPGDTLRTEARKITLADIERFSEFTGDRFYAHMDASAAARNPFFPGRVAHGYLLISFAAGLFVDPDEGPVLANTGLDSLRFLKPVEPGSEVSASLTVKQKTSRNDDYGEVRWHVSLMDQEGDSVAEYELLTMVAK